MPGKPMQVDDVEIQIDGKVIASRLSLRIRSGEFVCVMGPSGSGKSTLLNVLAGFLRPASGSACIGSAVVDGPDICHGIVFQSADVLFPWLTVRENVEFGPRMRGSTLGQRTEIGARFLRLVGLPHVADRFPSELSG